MTASSCPPESAVPVHVIADLALSPPWASRVAGLSRMLASACAPNRRRLDTLSSGLAGVTKALQTRTLVASCAEPGRPGGVMSGKKARRRHRAVLRLEPKRAYSTIGYAILTLLAAAVSTSATLYRTGHWPQQWQRLPATIPPRAIVIAAVVAGCLAVLWLIAAVVNGRRWHVAAAVERLSDDPAMAALMPDRTPVAPVGPRAGAYPPLGFDYVKPRRLPRPRDLRPVTLDRNIVGGKPLSIAYLRLFENQPRVRTFIQGAWREFGYVHLLRSAAAVRPSEFRLAKRSPDFSGLFITSRDQFITRLDGSSPEASAKHWRAFRDIGPLTIRAWDWYGSYPPRAFLCHGSIWREAVDVLLARVDLVVLDLSGFMPYNRGTRYELQRVVDRFPVERVIFLADKRSDLRFLSEQIQGAWQNMAVGSPNSSSRPRVARIAVTDRYQQVVQYQTQGQGQGQAQQAYVQTRLKASRRLTRRLAAAAAQGYAGRPLIADSSDGAYNGRSFAKIGAAAAAVLLIGAALAVLFVVLANRNVNSVGQSFSASPSPQVSSSGSCRSDTSRCTLGSRDLSRGDRGPDVTELQRELQHLGFYNSTLDGIFGPITEAAVERFQACSGLNPDGVADVSGQGTIPAIRHASLASVASCFATPATSPATSPGSTATSPTNTATPSASPDTSPPATATLPAP
jgi:Putative peptidoglycan binding domain